MVSRSFPTNEGLCDHFRPRESILGGGKVDERLQDQGLWRAKALLVRGPILKRIPIAVGA